MRRCSETMPRPRTIPGHRICEAAGRLFFAQGYRASAIVCGSRRPEYSSWSQIAAGHLAATGAA